MHELTIKEVIGKSYVDNSRDHRLSWRNGEDSVLTSRTPCSPVILMDSDDDAPDSTDYYVEHRDGKWVALITIPTSSADEGEHYESLEQLLTVFALRGYIYYY
jgi:hypothetical protein